MTQQLFARVSFDFRGKHHQVDVEVDLPALAEGGYSALYNQFARVGNIGQYSYEYEVLLDQPIHFHDPSPELADFLQGEDFDLGGFRLWLEGERVIGRLRVIAKVRLGVVDLDAQPDLRQALLDAWEAGADEAVVGR